MRFELFGDNEHEPDPSTAPELATEAVKTHLPVLLIQSVPVLEFEARKDAAQVTYTDTNQKCMGEGWLLFIKHIYTHWKPREAF